jgi:hypothetical protein
MTFEEKVHDTIMAVLSTTQVPLVSFAASDGSAFVAMSVAGAATLLPTQAEANAVQYVMEPAPAKLDTEYVASIAHVVWRAHVVYPKQVSLEALLESFSRRIEEEGGMRPFDLRLVSVDVEAPPRNDPANGTFLVMIIEAHPVPAR